MTQCSACCLRFWCTFSLVSLRLTVLLLVNWLLIVTYLDVVVHSHGGGSWIVSPEAWDGPVKWPKLPLVEARAAGDFLVVEASRQGVVTHFTLGMARLFMTTPVLMVMMTLSCKRKREEGQSGEVLKTYRKRLRFTTAGALNMYFILLAIARERERVRRRNSIVYVFIFLPRGHSKCVSLWSQWP